MLLSAIVVVVVAADAAKHQIHEAHTIAFLLNLSRHR